MGKWQRNYYTDETGHKHIDIVNTEQEAPAYVNPFVKTNLRLMKWVMYIGHVPKN